MDDLDFVRRCVKGDKQAWNEFLTRYSRLIYHYIFNTLSIKGCKITEIEATDIFQEIFQLLIKDNYKKLSTFQGKNNCSLASWLRLVTINYTVDCLRRHKEYVSIDAQEEGSLSLKDTLKDQAISARDSVLSQEELKALTECIEPLDTDDKYFLELYLNRRLSLNEIKEHLMINRGAVDMRKRRIFKRLVECFKNKGFFKLDFVA